MTLSLADEGRGGDGELSGNARTEDLVVGAPRMQAIFSIESAGLLSLQSQANSTESSPIKNALIINGFVSCSDFCIRPEQ